MIRRLAGSLLRDESGATALEYGLIVGLIFLAILGSLTVFGDTSTGIITKAMQSVSQGLT